MSRSPAIEEKRFKCGS